jgi:hypothetical protein
MNRKEKNIEGFLVTIDLDDDSEEAKFDRMVLDAINEALQNWTKEANNDLQS